MKTKQNETVAGTYLYHPSCHGQHAGLDKQLSGAQLNDGLLTDSTVFS